MKLLTNAAVFALAGLAVPAAAAINLGFESGSTAGWASVGTSYAATGYAGFAPVRGRYLGVVVAGQGADAYSTLTRLYTLSADQTIFGYVGFKANDYLPFNDNARLTIDDRVIWQSSVSAVGDFGDSGWVKWSYKAPTAGNYILQLGVANAMDNALPSAAVIDAVPEPASWALLLGGFGFIGAALRRRSRRQASVTA